MALIFGIQESA